MQTKNFRYGFAVVLTGLAFVLTGLAGCRPDTVCRQETDVAMGICVLWNDTNETGDTVAMNRWDSVEIRGVGTDTVPYVNARNAACVWMPLRADTGVSSYEMVWHGKTERIDIHHTNSRMWISNACGCMVAHTIDSVLFGGTAIDSVEILNSIVGNAEEENLLLIMNDELGIRN